MNKDIHALQAKVDQRYAQILNLEAEKVSLDNALKGGVFKPTAQRQLKKIARDIRSTKLLFGNAVGRLKEAQELQKANASIQSDVAPTVNNIEEILPENSTSGSTIGTSDAMDIDDPGHSCGSQTVMPHSGMSSLSTEVVAPSSLPELLPVSKDSDPTVFRPENPLAAPMEVFDDEVIFTQLDRYEDQGTVTSDSSDVLNNPSSTSTSIHDKGEMTLATVEDKVELQRSLDKLKRKPKQPKQKVKYVEIDGDDSGVDNKETAKEWAAAFKPNISSGNKSIPYMTAKDQRPGEKPEGEIIAAESTKSVGFAVTSKGRGKGRKKERALASTNDDDVAQEYQPSQHKIGKAERTAEAIAKKKVRAGDEESQMQIIEAWLLAVRNHTEKPTIPFPTRDLARKDSEYLARITTSDPRLAVEFLENSWHNYLCVHHINQDRKPVSEVNNLQGPIKIFGIPLSCNQNTSPQGTITRIPGHLHCGCDERVALAGFVMWKTWKVRALIEGKLIVEGLNKPFHPRQVLFLLQFFKSKFGYVVEDMFTNSTDEGEEMRKEADVMEKVANFCARRRWELIGEKMELNYIVDNDVELEEPQWI